MGVSKVTFRPVSDSEPPDGIFFIADTRIKLPDGSGVQYVVASVCTEMETTARFSLSSFNGVLLLASDKMVYDTSNCGEIIELAILAPFKSKRSNGELEKRLASCLETIRFLRHGFSSKGDAKEFSSRRRLRLGLGVPMKEASTKECRLKITHFEFKS